MEKTIQTYNLYNEKAANIISDFISIGLSAYDDVHGGSVGFNFGLLLDELKIWTSENLNGVVLDKYSRYISNVISGKKSNETISILYAACAWSHKKSFLTKKWSTSHASYAFPWSNKINNLL